MAKGIQIEGQPSPQGFLSQMESIRVAAPVIRVFQEFADPTTFTVRDKSQDYFHFGNRRLPRVDDFWVTVEAIRHFPYELTATTRKDIVRPGMEDHRGRGKFFQPLKIVLTGRDGFLSGGCIEAYPSLDSQLLEREEIPETMPVGQIDRGWGDSKLVKPLRLRASVCSDTSIQSPFNERSFPEGLTFNHMISEFHRAEAEMSAHLRRYKYKGAEEVVRGGFSMGIRLAAAASRAGRDAANKLRDR